ncbi:class I SAM-dependent methyltransferase [Rhodococcus jostii]|uniref:class I SAM-dependent methyltransferase n=1 Tax=Rhodococcus jostii TaxID=132919 RepID=UPI00364FC972
MGLGGKLLGGPGGHADDGSGGLIRRARLYEFFAAVGFGGFRRRVFDGLVALAGARPGDEVLDVGCGTGYFSRRAAPAVLPDGRVVGIDPSAPVIEYARRVSPPNCTFRVAGAEALPLYDASMDLVISSLAVHHIPPELRATALREAFRVLRPDGRLFIARLPATAQPRREPPRGNAQRARHATQSDPRTRRPDHRRRIRDHRTRRPPPAAALRARGAAGIALSPADTVEGPARSRRLHRRERADPGFDRRVEVRTGRDVVVIAVERTVDQGE